MLQRNCKIFDLKLLDSLSQFVTTMRAQEGAALHTIVGDMPSRLLDALPCSTIYPSANRELQA
ncbi:hypothetical protein DFP72DRAFT_1073845 [Ephemerocybe angulata]|uniref:Uncharacterized protein n=1 Tax=Ephemerocybe angulata TaxID=980116 RepID=A0A8H6LYG6_9AGAR|nr:hypothetical protein DFP72DRAFT_1073845 [Tulosesus angulatus]